MDLFGEVGIARVVMVRTLPGDTLEEIVRCFGMMGN